MARLYRATVDGRTFQVIARPGQTLDDVRRSVVGRFGAHRVTSIEPVKDSRPQG